MFESKSIQETCIQLDSDIDKGLTEKEAARRYQEYGKNELKEPRKKTVIESFLEQLNDPLIYVLLAAAIISLLLHEVSDAVIIAIVVFMNAIVGMIQEGKAQKALDSLKKLTSPRAYVIREGKEREIPASQLVVGDIVCLDAGCQVPADLRLTRTSSLKVEESALTGESLPIEKDAAFIARGAAAFGRSSLSGKMSDLAAADSGLTAAGKREAKVQKEMHIPLGDRYNMAYMSTIVTYGRGEGIVTATGMDTEIGKIASLINESHEDITPLQKRLGELGKILSLLSLLLCAALFLIALIQKRNMIEMLITAISLAVAAVPEGLPAVVTICLALSVTKMV